jgi:hypothetical protein
MFASFRDALTRKAAGSTRPRLRRRAALRGFEPLEDRTVLSQLSVLSAVGVGGDNLYIGGAANYFSYNKIGSTTIDSKGDIFITGEFAGTVFFDPQQTTTWKRTTPNNEYEMYVAEYGPKGDPVWVDVLGPPTGYYGSSFPLDLANGVAVDGSGNVYVTGSFDETINFDPNPNDTQQDVTPAYPYDPFFGFGTPTPDIFVLKLGSDGSFQAVKDIKDDTNGAFGYDGHGEGTSIIVDSSGKNVVVLGDFAGPINFGQGDVTSSYNYNNSTYDQDGFALDLNSSLSYQWQASLSSYAISTTSGGNLYVDGTNAAVTSAAFDPSGNVYVGGFYGAMDGYDNYGFISQINSAGALKQSLTIGGSENSGSGGYNDAVNGVAVDSQGYVYATGDFSGKAVDFNTDGSPSDTMDSSMSGEQTDAFIAKYNGNLELQWANRLGSNADDWALYSEGLALGAAGDVYFGGMFEASAFYGTDPNSQPTFNAVPSTTVYENSYVARVNAANGALMSTGGSPDVLVAGSSTGYTYIFDLAGNAAGDVSFTGYYPGGTHPTIGNTSALPSQGTNNAFIAELSAPTPTPVFSSPAAGSPVSVAALQDSTLQVSASDSNGESVTYSLNSPPSWASINASTGLITFTDPPKSAVGSTFSFTVEATVAGPPPASATDTFSVSVTAAPAPVIGPIGNPSPAPVGGQTSTIDVSATAPAGDSVNWNLSGQPSWITIASTGATTAVITLKPGTNDTGSFAFTLTATDTTTGETSNSKAVNLSVSKPSGPVINTPIPSPSPALVAGQTSTIDVSATDAAGDPIQWSLTGQPSWAQINPSTGVITLQPPNNVSGSFSFSVVATDTTAQVASSPQTVDVTVSKADRPVIGPIGNPSPAPVGGQTSTINVSATAPAGDSVMWNLSGPSWATIALTGPTTAVITLKPATSNSGSYAFTLSATDTTTGETSNPSVVNLSIAKPPAPTVNPISGPTITGGQASQVYATASNVPSGDAIQWSLGGQPSWAQINPSTGVITLQPPVNVGAQFSFNVYATDTATQETSSAMPLYVTVDKPNIAPVIPLIPSAFLSSGQSQLVGVPVTDVIGDPVRFSLANAPSWITIDPNSGAITVSPPMSVGGSTSVTVLATDAANPALVGSQTFTANVQGVAPQVLGGGVTTRIKKGATGITIYFSEPMDPGDASNAGHYTVRFSKTAKGKINKVLGGVVAQYNAANYSVILVLPKPQKFHILVTIGGVLAANGADGSGATYQVQ